MVKLLQKAALKNVMQCYITAGNLNACDLISSTSQLEHPVETATAPTPQTSQADKNLVDGKLLDIVLASPGSGGQQGPGLISMVGAQTASGWLYERVSTQTPVSPPPPPLTGKWVNAHTIPKQVTHLIPLIFCTIRLFLIIFIVLPCKTALCNMILHFVMFYKTRVIIVFYILLPLLIVIIITLFDYMHEILSIWTRSTFLTLKCSNSYQQVVFLINEPINMESWNICELFIWIYSFGVSKLNYDLRNFWTLIATSVVTNKHMVTYIFWSFIFKHFILAPNLLPSKF